MDFAWQTMNALADDAIEVDSLVEDSRTFRIDLNSMTLTMTMYLCCWYFCCWHRWCLCSAIRKHFDCCHYCWWWWCYCWRPIRTPSLLMLNQPMHYYWKRAANIHSGTSYYEFSHNHPNSQHSHCRKTLRSTNLFILFLCRRRRFVSIQDLISPLWFHFHWTWWYVQLSIQIHRMRRKKRKKMAMRKKGEIIIS